MKRAIQRTIWFGAALFACPLFSEERTFTSNDGRKIVASIVEATEARVTLKKADDGKEYVVPVERLSEEDREWIAGWLARRRVNTRAERELTLALGGGKSKKVTVPKGEYLSSDGTLTLYPGDTIHLEFEEMDGKLGQPSVVEEVTHPGRTISFAMTQDEKITMLTRKGKMRLTVAMDCTHRGLGAENFHRTNLRPTEKGLAAFDSWPNTVWTLRLSNLEVTERSASEVYEERVSK